MSELAPEVFIPSVPWRHNDLEDILNRLSAGTMLPRAVHVFLDGYGTTPDPVVPSNLNVIIERADPRRGPGYRWKAATERPDDTLALMLDDDLVLPFDYVANCVEHFEELQEPFSWNGVGIYPHTWLSPHTVTRAPVRLHMLGAGTAVVAASQLRDPEGDVDTGAEGAIYLSTIGHEEAWVSWWLTVKQGLRLWRPAGRSGLLFTDASNDPRAVKYAARERNVRMEASLKACGWPVLEPHPEKPTRFTGKAKPAPSGRPVIPATKTRFKGTAADPTRSRLPPPRT